MQSTNQPFHVSHILWQMDMIRFSRAPLFLPESTKSQIRLLPDSRNSQGTTLTNFLRVLPLYTLRDKMIEGLLPQEAFDLLQECNQLRSHKEQLVARQEIVAASRIQRAEDELRSKMKSLFPEQIPIELSDIVELLRRLGFDGELLPCE